ncbi:MAG TPA: alpha/beta fold hydrolase [Tepidisphaeraceae bacterium]|nr:alpha/beta fold hydrolase [Tepidisphaeraceae bacterium]
MSDRRPSSLAIVPALLVSLAVLSTGCGNRPATVVQTTTPQYASVSEPLTPRVPPIGARHGLRAFDGRAVPVTPAPATANQAAKLPADTVAAPAYASSSSLPGTLVVFNYGAGCSSTSWGNGLRDVANAIKQRFASNMVNVITRAWNDNDGIEQIVQNHRGPVVLIGHSFGGWKTLDLASKLTRKVDSMILLDPVPLPFHTALMSKDGSHFKQPTNVVNSVCFYRPGGVFPTAYPIANASMVGDNRPRDIGHSDFCSSPEVAQHILSTCQQVVLR